MMDERPDERVVLADWAPGDGAGEDPLEETGEIEATPSEGDGGERPRERRHRAVKRPPSWYASMSRRGRVALWAALVAWLLFGLAVFGGWGRVLVPRGREARGTGPRPDLVLVVAKGDPPSLPAIALVHRSRASRDVLLLPAGTIVEDPGADPEPLSTILQTSGPDTLATSVANALRVHVPRTLTGDPGAVRGLVDAVGGVQVDVPDTIQVVEGSVQRTLFQSGRTTMGGDEFLRFLTQSVAGQDELDRVARQNAAWRGLLARLASKREAAPAARSLGAWTGDMAGATGVDVLRAVARDPDLTISTLPVVRVGVSQADLYEIDRTQLRSVARMLRDVSTSASTSGRRVRLLVGADGDVGPVVARILVDAGYVIVLSGRASRPYDATTIVIADDTEALRATARRIVSLLGTGKLGLSKTPQTLVDVTLVVGRDWAAGHGFRQSNPAPSPTVKPRRGP